MMLNLDISMGASIDGLGNTFRKEGMSLNKKSLRFHGQEVFMEVTLDELEMGRRIGAGACSNVNIAKHVYTGEPYAVKMFNIYDEGQTEQLLHEVALLFSVQDCDALISLKGAFHEEGRIGIIIEYMDRGSLEFLMDVDCEEVVFAAIFYQILWGLGYLHYERQIHRDVKPANVLVNSFGQVKLSDFGISRSLDSSQAMSNTAVGTFRYMSPERLNNNFYHYGGDIWSVGIMMIELWTKQYPFHDVGSSPIELITELERFDPAELLAKSHMSGPMRDLIETMLSNDPAGRATCLDLVNYEWFVGNDITSLETAQEIVGNWLRDLDAMRSRSSRAESKHSGRHELGAKGGDDYAYRARK